jgi:signal transduction histidine kinase
VRATMFGVAMSSYALACCSLPVTIASIIPASLDPEPEHTPSRRGHHRKRTVSPVALIGILTLPLVVAWLAFLSPEGQPFRKAWLLASFVAMFVAGGFAFLRQFLLDRRLVQLLKKSRTGVEDLQRLQSQLVQKEKLASLGQLVAGAAPEIRDPLTVVVQQSDLLLSNSALDDNQTQLARKLGHQALRANDLVSGLLSFARQSPTERSSVDMRALLQRAVQMERGRLDAKNIRVEMNIPDHLPGVWGNANQLFHCCFQIILNAADAMEAMGAGTLAISGRQEASELVLEFCDTGHGIQEPKRVFDPFYTTKPIGKGAGLGLSSTYGLVQDHGGNISCHNLADGGAVFVLRLPITKAC